METVELQGSVRLECFGKDGKKKWDTGWFKNGITNAGKAAAAGRIGNVGSVDPFIYLAVGTSSTAFNVGQTALVAEITDSGLARASATMSRVTTTVADDTLQFFHEWSVTASKIVEEIGAFNDATAGVMLCRALTTSKAVDDEDVLRATYKVKLV